MTTNNKLIVELIHNIADSIDKKYNDNYSSGLYGEKGGGLLFMAYYTKYFCESRCNSLLDKYLENNFSEISEGLYQPSFSYGSSGILSLLNYLNEHNFIKVDIKDAENFYTTFLSDSMISYIKDGNYDFLHGSFGILYYFLLNRRTKCNDNFFNDFIDLLLTNAIRIDSNRIFWNDKFNNISCNISLAHGMSSIIVILSFMYKMNICKDRVKEIIIQATNFIISQKKTENDNSSFPNLNSRDDSSDPRLAWCYGDLGIGVALWQVGRILNRKDILDESLSIFKLCERRKDLIRNRVHDACFCHGTSGISHIFRRMYYNTRIKSFIETSNFWLNKTVELSKYDNSTVIFEYYYNNELISSNHSLLDGLAGIGMVLISSLLSEKASSWDSIFLLNNNFD